MSGNFPSTFDKNEIHMAYIPDIATVVARGVEHGINTARRITLMKLVANRNNVPFYRIIGDDRWLDGTLLLTPLGGGSVGGVWVSEKLIYYAGTL